jgi:hypothetical protein
MAVGEAYPERDCQRQVGDRVAEHRGERDAVRDVALCHAWSNHAANSAGITPTRYIVGSIMIWATSNVIGLPASQLAICSITQNATTKPSGGAMAAKIRKRVMVAIPWTASSVPDLNVACFATM